MNLKKKYTLIFCSICVFILSSCGKTENNELIGTWSVVSYELQDSPKSIEEMSDIFGTDFTKAYENKTITFYSDGTANLSISSTDNTTADYKYAGNEISFYDEENNIIVSLQYEDGKIKFDQGDSKITLIFGK